jgi:predicted transcriptional regulator
MNVTWLEGYVLMICAQVKVTNKERMSSLITINSKSSPPSAIDLMLKHNVRHLIVIDDEAADISKPIGIVTPLDLMKYEEYTRDDERKMFLK